MGEPLRALIVEDNEDDALLMVKTLEAGGFAPEYTRIETAEAMRRALEEGSWELVLADYNMPHFSGPAALRVLKESGQDLPFIVVSGNVTEEQAVEMMRQGAHDFILKQDLVRLAPAIRRELHEARLRRERRQALDALEREQAFFASAIDLLPFPIVFNTPDGEVIRANRASHRFFGNLDTDSWWKRQLLNPGTREPVPHDYWPMRRAARGEVVSPGEVILVLPDGREVDALAAAAPVYVRGELTATVVAFMDITPIKEADRAKTRFLAVLSHELRTPLTNILGWVKEAADNPNAVEEALHIIQRNAEMQRRMLERLLEISRLLYGKFELQLEPADLWQIAAGVAGDLRTEAAERQITIDAQAPPSPLRVIGDVKRLRAAIESVLENAIRFSDEGGHVLLRGRRVDNMAELSIRDQGRGVPADVLQNIFELFQVPQEAIRSGGSLGLGLPLAKAIMERHNGQISIASEGDGRGATVTIRLPLEE